MNNKVQIAKPLVTQEEIDAATKVLRSGRYVKGPEAEAFGKEFASYCGTKYGIPVNSGASALELALKAAGINPGDDVITATNSFMATANAIVNIGATPVFADVDETYTINVSSLELLITPKTKAVIPVHLYGHSADMRPILELAQKHNLKVVEDACQAHGAEYFGKRAGALGDVACFSFFPTKNMTVAGDGGMVVTNDEDLANKVKILSNHGRGSSDEDAELFGHNYRMSEILAAIGRIQLKKLDGFIERRRQIAKIYNGMLDQIVTAPIERSSYKHVYYTYVIRTPDRDALKVYLATQGVQAKVMYEKPIHLQTAYARQFRFEAGLCPIAEQFSQQILSLPVHAGLEDAEVLHVAESITAFLKGRI